MYYFLCYPLSSELPDIHSVPVLSELIQPLAQVVVGIRELLNLLLYIKLIILYWILSLELNIIPGTLFLGHYPWYKSNWISSLGHYPLNWILSLGHYPFNWILSHGHYPLNWILSFGHYSLNLILYHGHYPLNWILSLGHYPSFIIS